VVSPDVLGPSTDVTSTDGLTHTVTQRITRVTTTTQVTVNADNTVLKTVTTQTDVMNRTTIFNRAAPTQTNDSTASSDSLATQWTTGTSETTTVDRSVSSKTQKYTRYHEYGVTGAWYGSASGPSLAWRRTPPGEHPSQHDPANGLG